VITVTRAGEMLPEIAAVIGLAPTVRIYSRGGFARGEAQTARLSFGQEQIKREQEREVKGVPGI